MVEIACENNDERVDSDSDTIESSRDFREHIVCK
jgi:hypothetical protein